MSTPDRFIELGRTLRQAGLDLDPESIADTLWLAQWLPVGSPREPSVEPDVVIEQSVAVPPVLQGKADDASPPPDPAPAPPVPKPGDDDARKLFAGDGQLGGRRASAIRVPAASALPGALELARALRPFNRRRSAAHHFELDEEATAESIAQFQFVRPVLRPITERWFDVALVVDSALSMDPWRKTLDEFEQLISRHGAFGQVRRWKLLFEGGVALEAAGVRSTPKVLRDPRGRTLILIVTNGVADYWNSPSISEAMSEWAEVSPVAILQVFSERQWPHTALGPASRSVRAPLPGAANSKIQIERKKWDRNQPDGRVLAVPVLSLSPESVFRWAQAAMSMGLAGTPALVFGHRVALEVPEDDGSRIADPRALVQSFRTFASPEAFRLACYLSATTLTPPVMRIVQQEIARAPLVEHLAEVVASGLVERVTPSDKRLDPDNIVYDFRPGVRDVLLGSLHFATALEVRTLVEAALKNFIEKQLGRAIDNFRAFVLDDEGAYEIPESARALLEMERSLLLRFGLGSVSAKPKQGVLTLLGHSNRVNAVTFTPDASLLISGSDDRSIKIWNPKTGELLRTIFAHGGSVTCLVTSADGEYIITGSTDHKIRLWSPLDGRLLSTLEAETPGLSSLASFSPVNGMLRLASASARGLKVWDLAKQSEMLWFHKESLFKAVAASPDGRYLAISEDNRFHLFSSVDFQLVRTHDGHASAVETLAFAPDGLRIASGSRTEVVIWEMETGRQLRRSPDRNCRSQVAFSPDGRFLAFGVGVATLCLWDNQGDVRRVEGFRVTSLAFSPDGKSLAVGSDDQAVYILNLAGLTTDSVRLSGTAKNRRAVFLAGGAGPRERMLAEALTEGLRSAGHVVLLGTGSGPNVVVLIGSASNDVQLAEEIARENAVDVVPIQCQEGQDGMFDFRKQAEWQTSFEILLRYLDEIEVPGALVGVPAIPSDYWARKEHGQLLRARIATLRGPEGSGKHTLAAAFARDRSTRKRYRGGIHWKPTSYPTAQGPVLLVDPQFAWQESISPYDGVLVIDPSIEGTSPIVDTTITLADLSPAEQRTFAGAVPIPDVLLTPAFGRMNLLCRWKRILFHFGASKVAEWLSNRDVPQTYGEASLAFAARCLVELLPEENRIVLAELAKLDQELSIGGIAEWTMKARESIESAFAVATSLEMLAAPGSNQLSQEYRRALQGGGDPVANGGSPRFLFFACYARADRAVSDFIQLINETLGKLLGRRTEYFDFLAAELGDSWSDAIAEGLRQSSVLLVMLSPASVRSEWVRREIEYFQERGKAILPVLLDQCAIPSDLATLQYYDASGVGLRANGLHEPRSAGAAEDIARSLIALSRRAPRDRLSLDSTVLAEAVKNRGYGAILEDLYHQAQSDAATEAFYWRLLENARSGDVDWRQWFANILDQTRSAQ